MRKITGFWLGYLCLVLISACVQKDEPLGPERDTETGEAEILLPALPPGFLAKRSADSGDAMFILTISGPGMVTRKQAWPLTATAEPIKVTRIPVGHRLFTGELEVAGDIAFADSVWVPVEKGKTAQVNLKLTASSGNARVCVEIEGLPPPPGCRPAPRLPDVSGCWSFSQARVDTLIPSVLRIIQQDSLLQGEIRWLDGRRDTARGFVTVGGTVILGRLDTLATWSFVASVDTQGKTLKGTFTRKNGTPGYPLPLTATRITCGIVPDPVPNDSLTCFVAAQILDGKAADGRLLLLERKTQLYGVFQWTGFIGMPVYGFSAPVNGNKGLYLYGALPPGMSRLSGLQDSVHYKGQVDAGANILYGTINGIDTTGVHGQRGVWKGTAQPCRPDDIKVVHGAHRL